MNENARRRVALKTARAKQAEEQAALLQALNIPPEYLDKLKTDCLRAANDRLRGADPHAVVAEAARDLEARLHFLQGGVQ